MAGARKIPSVLRFDESTKTAVVRFDGQCKELKGNLITTFGNEKQLYVYGFASEFQGGSKLWDTTVVFYEKEPSVWRYETLKVPDWHRESNRDPPRIVGFFDAVPEDDRGIGHGPFRQLEIDSRRWRRPFWKK